MFFFPLTFILQTNKERKKTMYVETYCTQYGLGFINFGRPTFSI